ncbi:MAG: glycosyltransferase family 2 protein [Oscillospiraceae bacterium]|nr:glycosyltransferase family 2 protein [Oscillospiraceae bacterium]
MPTISIIIPCYRSEQTLPAVVDRVRAAVAAEPDYRYQIILINDRSPDNVWDVITALAAADPGILGIDLAKNFGQHAAILTGMRYAEGDYIACLDDDGQTPPEELFKLIRPLEDGQDVVFAKYTGKRQSGFRRFGSAVNDRMARFMLGKPKELAIMSYFACKRFIAKEVCRYPHAYPYVAGLLLRATSRAVNVEVTHRERLAGRSGYTFGKLLALWLNGFTAFSIKPLRIATVLGTVTALAGFGYGGYVIINKLLGGTAPLGWSATMAALLFIGGMLMLLLGLVGEYVGRIYLSINNTPQAVVRQMANEDGGTAVGAGLVSALPEDQMTVEDGEEE